MSLWDVWEKGYVIFSARLLIGCHVYSLQVLFAVPEGIRVILDTVYKLEDSMYKENWSITMPGEFRDPAIFLKGLFLLIFLSFSSNILYIPHDKFIFDQTPHDLNDEFLSYAHSETWRWGFPNFLSQSSLFTHFVLTVLKKSGNGEVR